MVCHVKMSNLVSYSAVCRLFTPNFLEARMTSVLAVVSLIAIMLAASLTLQPLLSSVSTSSSRGESFSTRADGRLLGVQCRFIVVHLLLMYLKTQDEPIYQAFPEKNFEKLTLCTAYVT